MCIVHLMCGGELDSVFARKSLPQGAGGVFIGGCHPRAGHYLAGTSKAQWRVDTLRGIPKGLGMDADRVRLPWITASELEILKRGEK